MSAATIPWEQYQQLPPAQRSRPLTDAEYAALIKQQRVALGLDEDDQGAPANFNGPVFPNPEHIQPRADTDPAIDPTRLPQGVSFQRGNWSGTPQMDISNPAAADVQPEMGREVGAKFGPKMSAQPIDFSKYETASPSVGQPIDFSKYAQGAPKTPPEPGAFDVQYPLTSAGWATASGLQSVGRGLSDAVTGTLQMFDPRPKNDEEQAIVATDEKNRVALPIYRILRSMGHTATDATQLAGAVHDINNSPDPVGTYARAAQEMAGQGAGQALLAAGTEGLARGIPKAVEGVRGALETPTGQAAIAGTKAALKKLPVAAVKRIPYVGPVVSDAVRAASEAAAEARAAAAPEAVASAEPAATVEEPAQPLPKPKAKTVKQSTALGPNAQVQTQAQSLGQPRTIVTDPWTGRLEFSDVVEAKQQAAAPPVETKAPQTETPAPQTPPKRPPVETPGPAADDLLNRLKTNAAQITKEESAKPGSADEDLTQQLQDSLALVRARKAAQMAAKAPGGALETVPEPGAGRIPFTTLR